MRISVFGLGYVGLVSAACFAKDGHHVIGVDINPNKVELLNAGESPIIEPGLSEMVGKAVRGGFLCATPDTQEAIAKSDISFICVGTPSHDSGALNLGQVQRVSRKIGAALRGKQGPHTVVFRSTMLPGSTEDLLIPILEAESRRQAGHDLDVGYNPEFLREGTAVRDFHEPPRTVIGSRDSQGGVLKNLYSHINAPLVLTDIKTAEMIKYADNAFHALKIAFANELGNLCKKFEIDSHKLMEIFVMDTKLNLSPAYLKPGFAFGGSCLPKDLRALVNKARAVNVEMPVIEAILKSNQQQKFLGFEMIRRTGRKKIGVLGLSFKQDTDDLRESPAVGLVEMLVAKGYDVLVYDHNVSLSSLMGSNLAYIERELPHISSLMCDTIDQVVEKAEVLVIANRDGRFRRAIDRLRSSDQIVIDLVRIMPDCTDLGFHYEGICW